MIAGGKTRTHWRRRLPGLVVAGLLGAAVVAPAQAQIGRSEGPIDISAERLEVVDKDRIALWTGNVEAKQGVNTLRSDRMRVFFTKTNTATGNVGESWGEIRTLKAEGNVFFITPEEVARGEFGTYQAAEDVIILTGNVVVTRGQNVLKGDKLIVEVATGKSVLESADRQGDAATSKKPERVRGVFYPKSDDAPKDASAQQSGPQGAPENP